MRDEMQCDVIEVHPQKVEKIRNHMLGQDQYHQLSELLSLLFQESLCVCDIAELLHMTHSAVSHQLSVLRQNRIIKFTRVGKNVVYSLDDAHIQMIYNAGLEHILE